MINSRQLQDLNPHTEKLCRAFIAACRAKNIDVLVTSTYRDNASQAMLYAQGRTLPGAKVTNARPGQSYHNHRCAFDFVPIVHGKAQWTDLSLFKQCGAIAKDVGLEWAGDWVHFKELAHCQYTGGLTLVDLQQGKKPA